MKRFSIALALILPLVTSTVGSAQSWIGNSGGAWANAANWSPNATPVLGDTATFDGIIGGSGSRTVVTAGDSISTIRFNSAIDYTFTGTGLNVDTSIQKQATSGANVLFSNNVTLLGNVNVSNASTTSLTFSNVSGNAADRQFNVTAGTGPIVVNGGGSNTIFNLGAGNNTLSGISSSTVNLSGGTNTIASATNTTININTLSGTNTITNVTGGSLNNTVSGATITGATNFGAGSSHSVAGMGIGTLNVDGNLSYNGATLTMDIGTGSFDQIVALGLSRTFSGSGSTLNLNFSPGIDFMTTTSWQLFSGFTSFTNPFTTINATGAAPGPGTFSLTNGTLSFITAVPEPSSISLVGIALVAGCVARRRKSAI